MTTHTPGPWKFTRDDDVYDANDDVVGGISGPTASEQRANARLVAAAPDMLEVLRSLVRDNAGVTHEYLHIIRAKARAAIAKAEGRT